MPAILPPVKLRPLVGRLCFKSMFTAVQCSRLAPLAEADRWEMHPSANPASDSQLCKGNWRSRQMHSATLAAKVAGLPVSLGFLRLIPTEEMQSMSRTLDAKGLMDKFAHWMKERRWADVKQLFEFWIRTSDADGNPKKPDVNLYNYYLQANLMVGTSTRKLLDLVAQTDDFGISPNTASFNVVLKAMQQAGETQAAEEFVERMLQNGKEYSEALPDGESYDLIIYTLLSANQIDSALKYIDLMLKSGYTLSMSTFIACVRACVKNERLDILESIIDRCKKIHQNKHLCPPWRICNYIADVAMQSDDSKLTYHAFDFMAKWVTGSKTTVSVIHSVDEGLVVSALATAGRTYNSKLLDLSWAVLRHSLQRQKVPAPESFLAKIYAHANLGNLQKAFSTLYEFEAAHGSSGRNIFSPFYSLNPLVRACSKKGFSTLNAVYCHLQHLGHADPPVKSISAINCIILAYANIWDGDGAYQAFNSIVGTFGLRPNIHSFSALICALGKLRKRDEAVEVFNLLIAQGIKPDMITYSILIDAHLIVRDPKAAISLINDMICTGYKPSKEILKKVRRRCIREMDYKSDAKVESLARQFEIQMGTEVRRDILFNLEYNKDQNKSRCTLF